jgi:ABC-type multidrug transport system ATPase subunit
MGSSGAGKSTLLNALAGRTDGKVSGFVLVNGLNRTPEFERRTVYGKRMIEFALRCLC